MSDSKAELRNKGLTLYRKGYTYKKIAEKLDVTESCVKSWATRYWKKDEYRLERRGQRIGEPRKRGGQPGNVNASGGQKGNTNALKHGAYANLLFSTFSQDKIDAVDVDMTEEEHLKYELKLLTIRESYLLDRIHKVENQPLFVAGVRKHEATTAEGEKIGTQETVTEANYIYIDRLERMLNQVQRQKESILRTMTALKVNNQRYGFNVEEKTNNLLDAILGSTAGDMDLNEIPELEPASEFVDDLVEQTESEEL